MALSPQERLIFCRHMIFSWSRSDTILLLSPTSAESRWPSVHRSDWSSPPYDISSIPLRHDSPPVPHLNKVQVALSQQELLIFIRRLLARFPSIKAISSMETSSTSLQLNYVSNKCLRPHTILTECLNKSLKQEMVARVNPFRALYRCDPSFDKPLFLFLFLFMFLSCSCSYLSISCFS